MCCCTEPAHTGFSPPPPRVQGLGVLHNEKRLTAGLATHSTGGRGLRLPPTVALSGTRLEAQAAFNHPYRLAERQI